MHLRLLRWYLVFLATVVLYDSAKMAEEQSGEAGADKTELHIMKVRDLSCYTIINPPSNSLKPDCFVDFYTSLVWLFNWISLIVRLVTITTGCNCHRNTPSSLIHLHLCYITVFMKIFLLFLRQSGLFSLIFLVH